MPSAGPLAAGRGGLGSHEYRFEVGQKAFAWKDEALSELLRGSGLFNCVKIEIPWVNRDAPEGSQKQRGLFPLVKIFPDWRKREPTRRASFNWASAICRPKGSSE